MKKFILIFIFFFVGLQAEEVSLKKGGYDKLYLMTIPKSGSHLMGRLIFLITGKKIYNITLGKSGNPGCFSPINTWSYPRFANDIEENGFKSSQIPFSHFNFSHLLEQYSRENPETKVIITIRDLRDVCISAVHFFTGLIEEDLGEEALMDERLMWVFTNGDGKHEDFFSNIARNTKIMLEWINCQHSYVFRFEDIIGPRGGGNSNDQNASIDALCEILGVQKLSKLEKRFILTNLFGKGSGTFRKGKIGAWKEHFKPEHKQEFKKRFGHYLIDLGYEEDDNW